MTILTTQDKEKIKRAIPKANNKIIDSTVARLYIAYPDHTQWKWTGLMGAVTLVDDLVGHLFFLKLVDITGLRGVVWDQELYVDFEYNLDRKYFHTFEIEEYLVGLLFEDTTDATHFYKRVTDRKKHGSKQTINNKNAIALKAKVTPAQKVVGPRGEHKEVITSQTSRRANGVVYYDDIPPPEWRSLYAELSSAGISEDMIADNKDFIKDYITTQGGPLVGLEPPIPRSRPEYSALDDVTRQIPKKPPPPPPPMYQDNTALVPDCVSSPQETRSESSNVVEHATPLAGSALPKLPGMEKPKFRLPPASVHIPQVPASLPSNHQMQHSSSPAANVSSLPPTIVSRVPPPAPPPRTSDLNRGSVPPPPPRTNVHAPAPVGNSISPSTPPHASRGPPPAPPRDRTMPVVNMKAPPPPARSIPLSQVTTIQALTSLHSSMPVSPPQPPIDLGIAVPAPQSFGGLQMPHPSLPINGNPPRPPSRDRNISPPTVTSGPKISESTGDHQRDALLASICGAGLKSLKQVDKSLLEKPSILLQDSREDTTPATSHGSNPGQPATLADALSHALNERKNKVSRSDDEEDEDW